MLHPLRTLGPCRGLSSFPRSQFRKKIGSLQSLNPPGDLCIVPTCESSVVDSLRCSRHVRTWRNHAVRCDLCGKIIEKVSPYRDLHDQTVVPAIHGRSELWAMGRFGILSLAIERVRLCRKHEHLHLMRNAGENLEKVAQSLAIDARFPECWTWKGSVRSSRGSRPMFVPVQGSSDAQWIAYRAVWHLTGQQPPGKRHELDHVGCKAADGSNARNTLCCNPLHLASKTPRENQKNRSKRASRPIAKHTTRGALYLSQLAGMPWPFKTTEQEQADARVYPVHLLMQYGDLKVSTDLKKYLL